MNIRRRGIAGLLAVGLLLPGVVACANGAGAESPEASATANDAKQALLDSTAAINEGNFRFTISGSGMTSEGSMHAPSRSGQMSMKFGEGTDFSMALDLIVIEPDSWVKTEISGMDDLAADLAELTGQTPPAANPNTGKYYHLDRTKVQGIEDLDVDFNDIDPAGSAALAKAVVDVQAVDGGYTGTIDLTKATDAGMTDEDVVKELGATAATVPFVAKLDGEGRLTELTLQVPAAGETKAHELKVTYAYGGATPAEAPPASEVVEATDETYEMFR